MRISTQSQGDGKTCHESTYGECARKTFYYHLAKENLMANIDIEKWPKKLKMLIKKKSK